MKRNRYHCASAKTVSARCLSAILALEIVVRRIIWQSERGEGGREGKRRRETHAHAHTYMYIHHDFWCLSVLPLLIRCQRHYLWVVLGNGRRFGAEFLWQGFYPDGGLDPPCISLDSPIYWQSCFSYCTGYICGYGYTQSEWAWGTVQSYNSRKNEWYLFFHAPKHHISLIMFCLWISAQDLIVSKFISPTFYDTLAD